MSGAGEERLEGELLGFSYRAEDGGFAVGRLRTGSGREVVVVGPIGTVTEGQHVNLEGRWGDHPQFGRQFKANRFLVEDPRTIRGLEAYLASGAVRGLGPTYARRVVERFGLDTLRVIEESPDRLKEVPGIGPKRFEEIRAHWERDHQNRELHIMLRGCGIGAALAGRSAERFGRDALAVVTREPYKLAAEVRGVGFRTADQIARQNGVSPDDPARVEAAILHVLREAEGHGHCFLPELALVERVEALEIPRTRTAETLERMAGLGQVVRHSAVDPAGRPVYLPRLEHAEARVARRVRALASRPREAPSGAALQVIEAELGLRLNGDQRRAVQMALTHGLTVITGGPGTGKTTIVRILSEAARQAGERWLLAAPTGRAARRLTEATGAEARTIHRLLEYQVRTSRFARGAESPLEADGVLIDEASMVDLPLMDALLAALPAHGRLVLVGDADQLPSVGAGRVLGDVIQSGEVPVATLSEVYRQARDSGIVRNAHRINQGATPLSSEREPETDGPTLQDFFVIEREDALEAQATLLEVVGRRLPRLGFDPMRDVQVLTPMHAGPLGTEALNERLQGMLNPATEAGAGFVRTAGAELVRGRKRLRVGDRVIQVRNNYDADVFNGDVGRVVAVEDGALEVDFDGRPVGCTGDGLDDLELAYAISIHKSQGSEYPAVVVVVHGAHRIMLRRNLLYTAVTRARRFCCVIGSAWAIETAARRRGGDERFTRLTERIADCG